MIWYSPLLNFPQFVVIYTVKGFGIISKAEVNVFLVFFCFFDVPMKVGNLISGSSAFSKSSLNIWNFMVHVLLKPGLENFELARYSVSKDVPGSVLKCETVLGTLDVTPKVPNTPVSLKGNTKVPGTTSFKPLLPS